MPTALRPLSIHVANALDDGDEIVKRPSLQPSTARVLSRFEALDRRFSGQAKRLGTEAVTSVSDQWNRYVTDFVARRSELSDGAAQSKLVSRLMDEPVLLNCPCSLVSVESSSRTRDARGSKKERKSRSSAGDDEGVDDQSIRRGQKMAECV